MTSSTETREYVMRSLPAVSDAEAVAAVAAVDGIMVQAFWGNRGKEARRYWTEERRLPLDLARQEGIGFAPVGWRYLLTAAVREGVRPEALVAAGIAFRRTRQIVTAYREAHAGNEPPDEAALSQFFADNLIDQPKYYRDGPLFELEDGRMEPGGFLSVPVRVDASNEAGAPRTEVRAWVRRSLRENVSKAGRYRDAMASQVFVPRDVILGMAGNDLTEERRVILVEGPFDMLAMRAALGSAPNSPLVLSLCGVGDRYLETSARPGSGVSLELARMAQAGRLAFLAGRDVTLCLDDDAAGRKGALRLALVLQPIVRSLAIVRAADADDPARATKGPLKDAGDVYRDLGANGVGRMLAASEKRGAITYAIEVLRDLVDERLRTRRWALSVLGPLMAGLAESARPYAIQFAAESLHVPAHVVAAAAADAPEDLHLAAEALFRARPGRNTAAV